MMVVSSSLKRRHRLCFNVPYAGHVEIRVLTFLYCTRQSDTWFSTQEIAQQIRDRPQDVHGALERLYKRNYVQKDKIHKRIAWSLKRENIRLVEDRLAELGMEEAVMARDERRRIETDKARQRCEQHISNAKGLEAADELLRAFNIVRGLYVLTHTYRWSHDGPFEKQDYEPVIYLYKRGDNLPTHAISFSHYGYVFHKNLIPWEDEDLSPKFPNSFHTPVLRAEKTEIRNGILSRGAYAAAKMSLIRNHIEVGPSSSDRRNGLPPSSVEISRKICEVMNNAESYWDELERL